MNKIVVIGGSVGAAHALRTILPMLPQDFPAAILIAIHVGAHKSVLPDTLDGYCAMPVRHATDGEPITPGHVLVAPPDKHLSVVMNHNQAYAQLLHGPKENHSRPAIDPLFRSAATAFGKNTIGVVLSGYLDDGTVGLQAVKAHRGLAIVQEPTEAEASDMPASALQYVDIDHVRGANEIGPMLVELVRSNLQPSGASHQDTEFVSQNWIDIENRIAAEDSDMDELEKIGKPSSLTCPECNGSLWEIYGNAPIRYRCHTGHAFTARVLEALQGDAVENAIWGAIRALHEQERLFSKLCEKEQLSGRNNSAAEYQAKATQARAHSQSLRALVTARALVAGRESS